MNERKYSVTRLIAVANAATRYIPDPSAIPTPATTQIVAAVVRPKTNPCDWSTAPAPRNPIPEMICAAIRVGSPPSNSATFFEMLMKRVEPTQIRMLVRRPAGLSRISRSIPMIPPSTAANNSLSGIDGSISPSLNDHRRSGKYKSSEQSALGAVVPSKNSVAPGYTCRPERSHIPAGQGKTENEAQPDIPARVNSVRQPQGPCSHISQRQQDASDGRIDRPQKRGVRILQVYRAEESRHPNDTGPFSHALHQ